MAEENDERKMNNGVMTTSRSKKLLSVAVTAVVPVTPISLIIDVRYSITVAAVVAIVIL